MVTLKDAKKILCEKIKWIFLIGVVAALCASGIKYAFTPTTALVGDFVYTSVIQINDDNENKLTNTDFNYVGVINTNYSYLKFIEESEHRGFNYEKINSAWGRMNTQDKVNWIRGKIKFQNFRDNVYEIIFRIPNVNISDLDYLEKNATSLIDAFILNSNDSIRAVKPNATIQLVNSAALSPSKTEIDKKNIAYKYTVYGFVSGIFLSTVVFLGIPLFKS